MFRVHKSIEKSPFKNGSGCCVHPHVPSTNPRTLGPWVATGGEGSEGATGGALPWKLRGILSEFDH